MKALSLQRSQRTPQILGLLPNYMGTKRSVRPRTVSLLANSCGKVKHDRGGQHMTFAGKFDEGLTIFGLGVCRIDNGQTSGRETLSGDVIKNVESRGRCGLVVFIISNQCSAEVGRKYLRRLKMPASECRLATPGGTDQKHERQFGYRNVHLENTPI